MRRFRGESIHKVDKKGRVSIPAPFRRIIEDGDSDKLEGTNASCVLVYGRKGRNCLEGYSIDAIEEVDELISKLPRYSRNREILERIINTQSIYSQIDDSGRLVLSQKLREIIGLVSEAVLVGMGDRFQIWEPKQYDIDMKLIENEVSDLDDFNSLFLV